MCEGGKFVFAIPRHWVPVGAVEDMAAWSLPVILEDNLSSPYVHFV